MSARPTHGLPRAIPAKARRRWCSQGSHMVPFYGTTPARRGEKWSCFACQQKGKRNVA